MEEKRAKRGPVYKTVLITIFATLAGAFLLLWLAVGTGGLKLIEGMTLINLRFVGQLDRQAVTDSAMKGMVSGLGDRWSYYLDPDWYQSEKLYRANVYVGVGITVTAEREEGLLIQKVAEGGPAAKAGIVPGELITAVDGVSLAGEARFTGGERIQGERGTSVALEVLAADGGIRTVTMRREAIEASPVQYQRLEGGAGYIKVENFDARCAADMKAAVEALEQQGATALVFDVRNNGGGYVNELTDVLDYLLPEGPIFRMRNRIGWEKVFDSDAACVDLKMAVLVNGESYSAAELFAAQLREAGAAVVVGTETSGKGYSQITYPLIGGGALGLSSCAYFTGGGVSLIGTGVTLDANLDLGEEQTARLAANALAPADDPQLQTALRLLGQ